MNQIGQLSSQQNLVRFYMFMGQDNSFGSIKKFAVLKNAQNEDEISPYFQRRGVEYVQYPSIP